MKILERRNRKTGVVIVLHRFDMNFKFYYQLECQWHKCKSMEYLTKKAAMFDMLYPCEWCIGCLEGRPAKEAEAEQVTL